MLAARGARHLLLLSRNAGKRASDRDFVKELEVMGCGAIAQPCDISSKESLAMLRQVMQEHGLPPVRGVVQGAMVLNDSIFERMTYESWQGTIGPKVDGTTNLASQFKEVDFFIMLSSLIGTSGHSSQANYGAASTFQDAFARHRASQGLPAVSLDVGLVQNVGYVADRDGFASRLVKLGLRRLSDQEILRLTEQGIRHPRRSVINSQIVTGIGAFDESSPNDAWKQESRFASLANPAPVDSASSGEQGSKGDRASGRSLLESLDKAGSWTEGVDILVGAVTAKLSEMFVVPQNEIDRTRAPIDYGVDSLVAVELRNWLFAHLQAELSIFEVMGSKSLNSLGEAAAGVSKLVKQAGLVKTT